MRIETVETLQSELDASVNFVSRGDFPGYLEARYVRRSPDYFVAYLSSQTGCRQACRMCHLTATGQTDIVNTTYDGFIDQARQVLGWYANLKEPAKIINYGFMARGEPLANPNLYSDNDGLLLLEELAEMALEMKLFPRFNISTIMPKCIGDKKLIELFPAYHPDFYYSIYSMDPEFRKKWLPNAKPAEEGLDLLKDWQAHTKKIVKLHWAFIEGENDDRDTVARVCEGVRERGLRVDINIVRYNPFSEEFGVEPSEQKIHDLVHYMKFILLDAKIKIVAKVGYDVKASCGMFVGNGRRT